MKFKQTEIGCIPEHWKVLPIRDVTMAVTDYVANGSFASLAANVSYKDDKDVAVLIRLVDYNNNFQGNFVYIDDHAYNFLSKSKLYGGEIIISNVGANVGTVFRCPTLPYKMSLAPNSIMVKFNENNDFYFHWLKSRNGQQMIKSIVTGSAQPKFNKTNFRQMLVPVPPIEEQNRIAAILNAIDDKINKNRQINDNLQQQLRTIFKAEFTDNPELENITQIPLSELCHVVTKGTTPTTLGKPFVESGINFIKAESILDDHSIDKSKFAFIDEETNALLKRSIIHAGDVVFTIAGTLGRFALIDENVLPANTNQAVAIIRADVEKVLPEYIYTCFIGEWHTDYYAKRVQQAVQANLSLTTIKSLPIPLLDEAKMSEYLSLILPLIKAIKTNEAQNEKLAALRDNLLPKLMSGEIDVSDIQF